MKNTKNLFLYQLVIMQLFFTTSGTIYANSYIEPTWDELQKAVYQANLKEVETLLHQKNYPQIPTYSFVDDTPIEIAKKGIEDEFLHPTTRQRYYKIYQLLQKHQLEINRTTNCIPINIKTIAMPTDIEMWPQYRQAHADKVDNQKKCKAVKDL